MKNLIIKDTPDGKIMMDGNNKSFSLNDVLSENYPIISMAMENEDYIPRVDKIDFFKEVMFADTVAGFVSVKVDEPDFTLTDIYILPEFRGNGLFKNVIKFFYLTMSPINIYLPTRQVVELLIKYGYAKVLYEGIVSSAIYFEIDSKDLYSNTNTPIDEFCTYKSLNYDLDRCSTFILENVSTPKFNIIYYTKALDLDKKRDIKIKPKTKKYFQDLKNFFINNFKENRKIQKELFSNLPTETLSLKELVGEDSSLGPYLQDNVDLKILDEDLAFEIKDELTENYREGRILEDGLFLNVKYNIQFQDDKDRIDEIFSMMDPLEAEAINGCPYCHRPVNPAESMCRICGYNLDYERDEDDVDDMLDMFDLDNPIAKFMMLKEAHSSLNYSYEDIPDNYDISGILHSAYFLFDSMSGENPVGEELVYFVASRFNLNPNLLTGYLYKEGVLSPIVDEYSWEEDSSKFTVKFLKEILKTYDLSVSGSRAQLLKRINDNIPISNLDGNRYAVFEDSNKDRLMDLFILSIFTNFYYDEVKFHIKSLYSAEKDGLVFLDKCEEEFFKRGDYFGLLNVYEAKHNIYESENDDINACLSLLHSFILKINLLYLDEDFYSFVDIEDEELFDSISDYAIDLDDSKVFDLFEKASLSFDKWLVPKEEIFKVLKLVVNLDDTFDILSDIFKKYYGREESPLIVDLRGRSLF